MNKRCLIVGGGTAGMSSAIMLRALGITVDLVEIAPDWRVYGAGITITRPTFRAFRDLGVMEDMVAAGFAGDGIRICRPDGTPIGKVDDPEIKGDALPGSGGIMRPAMHAVLADRVRKSGTSIHLGVTVDSLTEADDHVTVRLSDGREERYDFVIGADGIFSRVRELVMPEAPTPEYTGQCIWRLMAPRPPEVTSRYYFLGGEVKLGLCPVSQTELYMFLLERTPRHPIYPQAELHERLRPMMEGYGGPVEALRDGLNPRSEIVLRPLESFFLPAPWHRGRVLLIGDAAHPTTPQLASGAGMAVEDAIVLSQEMGRADGNVMTAFDAFMKRRLPRCQYIVKNSIEIGRLEQAGRSPNEQTELVEKSLARLAEPI